MTKIPTLLSGPIIRRVEPSQIIIWLATSEKFHMEAEIYQIIQNDHDADPDYEPIQAFTEAKTICAGSNLYISLLKIHPYSGAFPTDTLIGYNLFFSNKNEMLDLSSFDLLSIENPNAIVYGNLHYPSFYIQKDNPPTILYGSCRKPHGEGNDVMASADLTIQEHHLTIDKRPSYLFLMGDQIYADDVADPFFHMLSSWSKRIMGEGERLDNIDERLRLNAFRSSVDKVRGRQYIMENFCGFTSGNAANHLMHFREYALMYVMTLGPALWESQHTRLPTFMELIDSNAIHFMYPNQERYKRQHEREQKRHHKKYKRQVNELLPFIKTLPQIRRVLANTPTYMIFDDHDITDDWNISMEWQENVYDAPLGRHVIANGLAAYWLFQGWGNNPDAFDTTFIETMSHYFENFTAQDALYDEWVNRLWNFHSWHFIAPTQPVSLFLDTRTMREFDIVPKPVRVGNFIYEDTNAPQLIGKKGWELISSNFRANNLVEGESFIIISPTPLYGIGIIESFLHRYVYPLRILGLPIRYTLDFEAWKYNGKGFNRFLQQIAAWNPRQCFILSGDVHYASSVKSDVSLNENQQISIHQFTSSPIHNMSFSGIWGFFMKVSIWFNTLKRKNRVIYRSCDDDDNLISEEKCCERPKWQEKIKYLSPIGGPIVETKNNIGLLTLNSAYVGNKLLKYNGNEKQEVPYKSSTLN